MAQRGLGTTALEYLTGSTVRMASTPSLHVPQVYQGFGLVGKRGDRRSGEKVRAARCTPHAGDAFVRCGGGAEEARSDCAVCCAFIGLTARRGR